MQIVIDQLREQIQRRLDELAHEAEQLRGALAALGRAPVQAAGPVRRRASRAAGATRRRAVSVVAQAPAVRRVRTRKPAAATGSAKPVRQRARVAEAPVADSSATPGARAVRARRAAAPAAEGVRRTRPGATKAAVLAALAGGEAMTAGQVAAKAGLESRTVSTTLNKLSKSGDVQKAERGYRLPVGESGASSSAGESAESAE